MGQIITAMLAVEKQSREVDRASRDAWVTLARAEFKPSEQLPCYVCNKFRTLAEAHHVEPLARQYLDHPEYINHRHVWLCPTHHVAIHRLLARAGDDDRALGRRSAGVITEVPQAHLRRLLTLVRMSGTGAFR